MGKGNKMIVFYERPNSCTLPYKVIKKVEVRDKNGQIVYDDKGNVKTINKNGFEYFKFVPGKNIISPALWVKVVAYNRKNWDHYSTILKVFKGEFDKKTNVEIGADEDKINLDDLSPSEMNQLVENTMDYNDIIRYEKKEKSKDRPRQSVLKMIKRRKAIISEVDKAFEENK